MGKSLLCCSVVSAFGSVNRAYTCAGTAIDAFVGIYLIFSVLINGYRTHGTFRFAGAAAYTKVFVNNICHDNYLSFLSLEEYTFVVCYNNTYHKIFQVDFILFYESDYTCTARNACSKSAVISSISSIPTDILTKPGEIPAALSCSSVSCL